MSKTYSPPKKVFAVRYEPPKPGPRISRPALRKELPRRGAKEALRLQSRYPGRALVFVAYPPELAAPGSGFETRVFLRPALHEIRAMTQQGCTVWDVEPPPSAVPDNQQGD